MLQIKYSADKNGQAWGAVHYNTCYCNNDIAVFYEGCIESECVLGCLGYRNTDIIIAMQHCAIV